MLDLGSGVFTCFTPGYYTVSFSAQAIVGPSFTSTNLFLYKNGSRLPESSWHLAIDAGALNNNVGVTGSRILVSNLLEMLPNVKSPFLQILHMDEGDILELRVIDGDYIYAITLNIELIGLGFDYLV